MNKKMISRRNFMKTLAFSGMGLVAYKATGAFASTPEVDSSVEDLARRYFDPTTEDNINLWYDAYRKMDFLQMERFNDYVAQYTIELGQDQGENAVAKIENARRIRSEVNRQSQRIYGVPFNQLDGELFLALMEDVWHSESLGDESVSSCEAETASVTELSSCSCSTFSYVTSPGGFAAWYNSSGRRRLANWP